MQSDALTKLRGLVDTGLRDHDQAWHYVLAATAELPSDPQVERLRLKLVDLLQAIEVETILGGEVAPFQQQLLQLIEWIERHVQQT